MFCVMKYFSFELAFFKWNSNKLILSTEYLVLLDQYFTYSQYNWTALVRGKISKIERSLYDILDFFDWIWILYLPPLRDD